jgi:hypothetical protein
MPDKEEFLIRGNDQLSAVFNDLRVEHKKGNPFALHEVLARSRRNRLPLPDWAIEALQATIVNNLTGKSLGRVGKDTSPIKTCRNQVIFEMRWRTYQSIMAWLRDPREYQEMPRTVIQKWYDKKIEHGRTNGETALKLAVEALAPTFAYCLESTLLEARYGDPLKKLPKEARDFHGRPRVIHDFGIEETKWVPEYLNYFGPPGPPPDHIASMLEELGPR